MGIHNESGTTRVSPVPPLSKLMPDLVHMLIDTKDTDRSFVPFKGRDHVVLLVNNLGGLSELEVGGLVSEVSPCISIYTPLLTDFFIGKKGG